MTQQQLYNSFNECGKLKPDFKFLELGTFDGVLFSSLTNIEHKYTVDLTIPEILKKLPNVFQKSTDDFFKDNETVGFDLVFIDANHNIDFVIRDYNSAVDVLKEDGIIVFHDCYPPNASYCDPRLCSDSYKILEAFARLGYNVIFTKSNFGVTLIRSARHIDPMQVNNSLQYDNFINIMEDTYKNTEVAYQDLLDIITNNFR